ncbi:hypothetical protein [Polaribacter sp.]|uniref:hypothetical protein n=1 Tax=Polaribacter sp. TaxID=1920175 RepID=UPI003F6A9EA2
MNKLLPIFIFLTLTFFSVKSQTVYFKGSVSQNDTAIDLNGNMINVGAISGDVDFSPGDDNYKFSISQLGDVNAYITKISSTGEVLWAYVLKTEKINESPLEISRITNVDTDSDNNIYVAGSYKGILHLDDSKVLNSGSVDNYNSFIIKYDADGNILCYKEYLDYDVQQNGFAEEYIHQIKIANDKLYVGLTLKGNVDFGFKTSSDSSIISESSNNGTLNDAVVIQYDLDGTEHRIDRIEGVDTGFNILDNVDLIFVDFAVSDEFTVLLARSGSGRTLKIINLSNSGSITNVETLTVNNGFSSFFPVKIALDDSNNIFMAGRFSGSVDIDPNLSVNNTLIAESAKTDIFILKLNANAEFIWSKQIPNPSAIYTQMLNDLEIVNGNPIIYGNVRIRPTFNYDLSGENIEGATVEGENGFFVSEFLSADGAFSKASFLRYYNTFGTVPEQNFGVDLEFYNDEIYISGPLLHTGTVDFLDQSITLETLKFGSFISKFSIDNLSATLTTTTNNIGSERVNIYQNNSKFIANTTDVELKVYTILGKEIANRNLKLGVYLIKVIDKKTNKFIVFKRIIQ